ncbi:MAG: GtrA family protein [Chitinophagales bacterium]
MTKTERWRKEFHIFAKAQASSFIGGMSDYGVMVLLTELGSVFYPVSIVISGLIGAVVNFSLNKYWTYNAAIQSQWKQSNTAASSSWKSVISGDQALQIRRFAVVVAGSIALKSSGTYLFTEMGHIDYKLVRLAVDAVVAVGFNFVLMKYWVFRAPARDDQKH